MSITDSHKLVDASDFFNVLYRGTSIKHAKFKSDKFGCLPCLYYMQTFTFITKKQLNVLFKGAFVLITTSVTLLHLNR